MMFISFFIRSLLLAALPVTLVITGFGTDYEDLITAREQYATNEQNDIVIVAIKEPWAESYLNGIKLAVNQINERKGKLLGRRLRLQIEEGSEDYDKDRQTIMRIASDPQVSAVLGHHKTELAIPASVIYEQSHVVFMPPLSTGKDTTTHNFNYVFRMIPHNGVMARQLASVAKLLGYKNIALLYSFGYSRRELAFLFEDAAVELKMHFAARRSFDAQKVDYRDLIAQISKLPLDMVFLSTDTKSGARMIRQLREMGVTAPVMGGSSLNLSPLKDMVGESGNGTIVPAFYHPRADNRHHVRFIEQYKSAYQKAPDQNAAQGYDSVNLLAHAIEEGKSSDPRAISSSLHHLPFWVGITGVHSFDTRGDVVGKKYFFQVLQSGQWHWLPVVHFPYILWQFDRQSAVAGTSDMAPKNGFVRAFVNVRNDAELRILQLNFLHEIFRFGRLGMIYAEDGQYNTRTTLSNTRAFAKQAKLRLETCGVNQTGVTPEDLEKQLIRCLGKLSLQVDMINITGLEGLKPDMLRRLQAPLDEYKIPLISLLGDTNLGEFASLRLGRFGNSYNTSSEGFVTLFGNIVKNQHVHDLSQKVENLPIVDVNLEKLNDYNLLRNSPLVQLAPDFLIETGKQGH
ncbi:MAG: hypothetical protein RLZZ226_1082 [Pseudomonadota bacterium]|jgi:branched-chain amino acid transport system substrate-binding protein